MKIQREALRTNRRLGTSTRLRPDALFQIVRRDPDDRREVARHDRQHARREERDQPGGERQRYADARRGVRGGGEQQRGVAHDARHRAAPVGRAPRSSLSSRSNRATRSDSSRRARSTASSPRGRWGAPRSALAGARRARWASRCRRAAGDLVEGRPWRARLAGGRRDGRLRTAALLQQLCVALLLVARTTLQARRQARDRSIGRASRGPRRAPPKACIRSPRCLSSPGVCAPRSMSTQVSACSAVVQRQRFGEAMAVLGRAAAGAAGQAHQAAPLQPMQRVADRRVVVLDDRLAVGRLVAGQAQRVQRQRVDVRGRALLLQQAAEHAQLLGAERKTTRRHRSVAGRRLHAHDATEAGLPRRTPD